ncbi:hypothetical protein ACFSEO_14335 [Agromyces cerinus subsp. nitratus]
MPRPIAAPIRTRDPVPDAAPLVGSVVDSGPGSGVGCRDYA